MFYKCFIILILKKQELLFKNLFYNSVSLKIAETMFLISCSHSSIFTNIFYKESEFKYN